MTTQPPSTEPPNNKKEISTATLLEMLSNREDTLDEILSDRNRIIEKSHLRDKVVEELNCIITKIDLDKLRWSSSKLIDISQELRDIKTFIGSDVARYDRYSSAVAELIENGNGALKTIIEELTKSGYLDFIEKLSLKRVFITLEIKKEDLPITERELLSRLGLSEEQNDTLRNIITALVKGTIKDEWIQETELYSELCVISNALTKSIEILNNYKNYDKNNKNNKKKNTFIIAGAYKLFFGVGLMGLNVAGFMATFGFIMSVDNTLTSSIYGGAMIIDGAKDIDLGILDSKMLNNHIQLTPRAPRRYGSVCRLK